MPRSAFRAHLSQCPLRTSSYEDPGVVSAAVSNRDPALADSAARRGAGCRPRTPMPSCGWRRPPRLSNRFRSNQSWPSWSAVAFWVCARQPMDGRADPPRVAGLDAHLRKGVVLCEEARRAARHRRDLAP